MVAINCAVDTCWGSRESKHLFPNPVKNMDLFQKWIKLCGNKRLLQMAPEQVFKSCRVCSKHFTASDFASNNRISHQAYPTKLLPVDKDVVPFTSQTLPELEDIEITTASLSDRNVLLVTPSTSQDQLIPIAAKSEKKRNQLLLSMGLRRKAELTPKKKFLYNELTNMKKINMNLNKRKASFKRRLFEATKFSKDNSFHNLVENLTSIQKRFFQCQLENSNKKKKGRRFSNDDKVLALALLKQAGSSTYRYLSKIFTLPSKSTILKFLNKIRIRPGFNEVVFRALKSESKLFESEQDKYCMLMFDEMSIATHLSYNSTEDCVEGFDTTGSKRNEFANHSQVFMIRGIRKRWKQPIFYNFTAGPAKTLDISNNLKMLILKLKEAGYIVCAIICDQGSNNSAALNKLVSETREEKLRRGEEMDISEFFFEIEGQKIIPLFDPPHLIKCIRNNLVKNNLMYYSDGKKKVAKWSHIELAYKMDPYFGSLRTMPKITDCHVVPEKIAKMKVSYCTQALSRSVAVAINLMATSETTLELNGRTLKMEKDAVETAEAIEFFDNLFDSLNSVGRSPKPLRRPVREKSPHFDFWLQAKQKLGSMKFFNEEGKTFTPPCLKNFIKTTHNFSELYKLLRGLGFGFIKTRQFNQDPLENFFGQMRSHGGRYVNPTCETFSQLFKTHLIQSLAGKHSPSSNCQSDNDDMFLSLKHLMAETSETNEQRQESMPIDFPENNNLPYLENQVLTYVLGWVQKKIKPLVKDCATCKTKLFTETPDERHSFVLQKEFVVQRGLIYVSHGFQNELTSIYLGLKLYFGEHLAKNQLVFDILNSLRSKEKFTCESHSHLSDIIIKKFINVTMFNYIKQINNILNLKDSRKLTPKAPIMFHKARQVALKKYSKKIIKY